jgi:hypothetical protein
VLLVADSTSNFTNEGLLAPALPGELAAAAARFPLLRDLVAASSASRSGIIFFQLENVFWFNCSILQKLAWLSPEILHRFSVSRQNASFSASLALPPFLAAVSILALPSLPDAYYQTLKRFAFTDADSGAFTIEA